MSTLCQTAVFRMYINNIHFLITGPQINIFQPAPATWQNNILRLPLITYPY